MFLGRTPCCLIVFVSCLLGIKCLAVAVGAVPEKLYAAGVWPLASPLVGRFRCLASCFFMEAVADVLLLKIGSWQEALREYREQGRSNNLEIGTRPPRNSIKGDINSTSLEALLGRYEARQPAFHANMPRHVSTSDNPIKKQREYNISIGSTDSRSSSAAAPVFQRRHQQPSILGITKSRSKIEDRFWAHQPAQRKTAGKPTPSNAEGTSTQIQHNSSRRNNQNQGVIQMEKPAASKNCNTPDPKPSNARIREQHQQHS
ncbi:hypothetical protein Nepgr_023000 [Nepenthes gracilis]|uniref:Uncharacterized protein n=1 Tax=Nepenthes gracilis TaxID=150966 RepID=A0AAD3T1A0_NEPGR|nr:hypothetical protein Nepgr_023000 [Nepenthes gracilis]